MVQKVWENTRLVCTPGSYFERLEFDDSYQLNTTCNGIVEKSGPYFLGIYIGYRKDKYGQIKREVINAGDWRWLIGNNNGRLFHKSNKYIYS